MKSKVTIICFVEVKICLLAVIVIRKSDNEKISDKTKTK